MFRYKRYKVAAAAACVVTVLHFIISFVGDPDSLQKGICISHPHAVMGPMSNWPTVAKSMQLVSDNPEAIFKKPWGGLPLACKSKRYELDSKSLHISVILAYHESEHVSHILHTIHSVAQRTPASFIKEIVLIEDFSLKEDHKQVLELYVQLQFSFPVRVYRSKETLGLIKARLYGAKMATGDVLVFMDSHMEVQPVWLEPLLHEIVQDPKTMATSYLDWMTPPQVASSDKAKIDPWVYTQGASTWKTYFNWNFVFGFQELSLKEIKRRNVDQTEPVPCFISVGGMFAIKRDWFFEIGAYDPGMEGWGGENIDLPVRVWSCGGRVINVPCSHAAHLEKPGHRDYRRGWEKRTHLNYKRFVEVWAGPYKKHFYYYFPQVKDEDPGDLSERIAIRERCEKNFTWILQNISPELGLPEDDSLAWDGVMNLGVKKCLDTRYGTTPGLFDCSAEGADDQKFFWSKLGEIRFPMHIFTEQNKQLERREYTTSYQMNKDSIFFHFEDGPMIDTTSRLCLEATQDDKVHLTNCDPMSKLQKWRWSKYTKAYEELYSNIEGDMKTISSDVLEKQFQTYVNRVRDIGMEKLR